MIIEFQVICLVVLVCCEHYSINLVNAFMCVCFMSTGPYKSFYCFSLLLLELIYPQCYCLVFRFICNCNNFVFSCMRVYYVMDILEYLDTNIDQFDSTLISALFFFLHLFLSNLIFFVSC